MAQLDVFVNLDRESSVEVPFLLDVQHGIHSDLKTRVMVPLVRTDAQKAGIKNLCPVFVIEGQNVFASVPEISAYPVKELGNRVINLAAEREEIFSALDFLLHGF